MVEHTQIQEQERDDDDKRDEGRQRARGEHPVVDLEHEQRPRQHQQVHEGAEQRAREEQPAAFGEGLRDFPHAVLTHRHGKSASPALRNVQIIETGTATESDACAEPHFRKRTEHHRGREWPVAIEPDASVLRPDSCSEIFPGFDLGNGTISRDNHPLGPENTRDRGDIGGDLRDRDPANRGNGPHRRNPAHPTKSMPETWPPTRRES